MSASSLNPSAVFADAVEWPGNSGPTPRPQRIQLVFGRASGRIRCSSVRAAVLESEDVGGAVKRDPSFSARYLSSLSTKRRFPGFLFLALLLIAAAFVLPLRARSQGPAQSPPDGDKTKTETPAAASPTVATPAAAAPTATTPPAATSTTATPAAAPLTPAPPDTPHDTATAAPPAETKVAAKVPDDVRKDTPGVVISKNKGMKLDVDLALINATVTDPYNRLVTGLDPDNFRIFEDNVEQEVVTFSAEDVPISIGVIFDYSGSMANKVAKAREAAIQFFKSANPQDEFFLVSFNERAELTSTFTNSVEDLQSRMMLAAPKGRTALLDAIYLGLSEMRGAHNAKRALLILSDGGDNHSRYNESDIKRLVKEADTQLYAIGIFDPSGYRNRTPEEGNGPSLLGEVTELTGGRVFPVEKMEDLPDIATKIGMELRNQYVLGYHPSNHTHDARWRKVKVKLRTPRGLPPLTVYAKTGYYAPSH
jgi:Ca-activated chloride channel homolog